MQQGPEHQGTNANAAERWDSDPAWGAARERAREDVQRALGPRARTCPECGEETVTAARTCPSCGASFVQWRPGGLSGRAKWSIAGVAALLAVGGTVAGLLLAPGIEHTKRAQRAEQARARASFDAAELTRRRTLQRLHRGSGGHPGGGRAALLVDLQAAITADARARVAGHVFHGPIVRTSCQPVRFGPLVPGPARGGYECNAVNSNVIANGSSDAGSVGYPFWAIVDFRRASFAWCAIVPPSGEGATQLRAPSVPPPKGCDLQI